MAEYEFVATGHGPDTEWVVRPNDEPERGRVKVIARCVCGHQESGFGNVGKSARRSALSKLHRHIAEVTIE